MSPDLTVVIPVYNSAETLNTLFERLRRVLDGQNYRWDVVFVDDGSRDDSWKILSQLQNSNRRCVTAVQLMRNFGQHNALMCGFHQAGGAIVVTIDDDLQNPPEEIPKLIDHLIQNDLDVVYGSIHGHKQHHPTRNLGSWLVTSFGMLVFGTNVRATPFRAIRQEVLKNIQSFDLNYTYIDGLLCWSTQRIGSVNVEHAPRQIGQSGYSWRKLATLAINMLTNFSLLPLQMVSLLGFLFAGFGLLMGAFYLVQYFLGNITQAGFASIIIAIAVMGGVQLLSLGVMGEYLGRIHLNINRKPQFVVRRVVLADTQEIDSSDREAAGQQSDTL